MWFAWKCSFKFWIDFSIMHLTRSKWCRYRVLIIVQDSELDYVYFVFSLFQCLNTFILKSPVTLVDLSVGSFPWFSSKLASRLLFLRKTLMKGSPMLGLGHSCRQIRLNSTIQPYPIKSSIALYIIYLFFFNVPLNKLFSSWRFSNLFRYAACSSYEP